MFGIAESSTEINAGFKIDSYDVTAVRKNGCELHVTLCKGDLCEVKKSFYAFPTATIPLQSPEDFYKILSDVRTKTCTPNPLWLVNDPRAFVLMVLSGILAYFTCVVGVDGMTDAILSKPFLENAIGAIFDSETFPFYAVIAFVLCLL